MSSLSLSPTTPAAFQRVLCRQVVGNAFARSVTSWLGSGGPAHHPPRRPECWIHCPLRDSADHAARGRPSGTAIRPFTSSTSHCSPANAREASPAASVHSTLTSTKRNPRQFRSVASCANRSDTRIGFRHCRIRNTWTSGCSERESTGTGSNPEPPR